MAVRTTSRVIYRDRGFKRFLRSMEKLDGYKAKVGYTEEHAHKYDDGTFVATVAAINQFGSPKKNIPARPFITKAFDDNQVQLGKFIQNNLERVVDGNMNPKQAVEDIADKHEKQIRLKILNGKFAPNAPSTIAKKGHGRTLRDTLRMLTSTSYVVEK